MIDIIYIYITLVITLLISIVIDFLNGSMATHAGITGWQRRSVRDDPSDQRFEGNMVMMVMMVRIVGNHPQNGSDLIYPLVH